MSTYFIWLLAKRNFKKICLSPYAPLMMTSSNGNIFRVTDHLCGEFTGSRWIPGPTQRPVTRSIDFYFDLRRDKRLSKQSWGWWFETLSHPLWRHRNGCIWHCTAVSASRAMAVIDSHIYAETVLKSLVPNLYQIHCILLGIFCR